MSEELGIIGEDKSSSKNASVTFFSFPIFGIIPLLPFIVAKIAKSAD